MQDKIILSV